MSSDYQKETSEDSPSTKIVLSGQDEFDMNHCFKEIGSFGLFQAFALIVYSLPFASWGVFIITLPLFEVFPQYLCASSPDEEFQSCSREDVCSGDSSLIWKINWDSDQSLHNWIVDFDLHYIEVVWIGFIGGLAFFAQLMGSVFITLIQSKCDRLTLTKFFQVLMIIGTLLIYASRSYVTYCIGIFAFQFPFLLLQSDILIYATECMEDKHGSIVVSMTQTLEFFTSITCLLVMKYVTSNWKTFLLVLFFMQIPVQVLSLLTPKSPKYLYSQKRYQEVESSLRTIFRINQAWNPSLDPQVFEEHIDRLRQMNEGIKYVALNEVHEVSMIQLLQSDRRFRHSMLLSTVMYLAVQFMFILTTFFSKHLQGSLFQNYFLVQAADLSGSFLNLFFYNKLGLNRAIATAYVVAALGAMLLLLQIDSPMVLVVSVFMMSFGTGQLTLLILQAYIDNFDSSVVAQAMGLGYIIARLSSAAASFVAEIKAPVPLLSFIAIGTLSIISSQLMKPKVSY